MVVRKYYSTRTDGVVLYRTYSDNGYKILQNETNRIYDEAIDVESGTYTYSETSELVETDATEEEMYAEAGKILLGVTE